MIELVYKKPMVGKSTIEVMSIAVTLYRSNRDAFVIGRIDPFDYLRRLKLYGVKAMAIPLKKEKKVIGYKFRNHE